MGLSNLNAMRYVVHNHELWNKDFSMNTYTDKSQKNNHQSITKEAFKKQSYAESAFQFVDKRPESIAQRKLQEIANISPKLRQLEASQELANNSYQTKQSAQLQADYHQAQQLIQLMKWPTRKQPNVSGTLWADQEIEEIQALYEWCKNISQFNKIIASITYDEWDSDKSFVTESNRERFDSEMEAGQGKEYILGLFQYFKTQRSTARVLKVYDESTYTFPSTKAIELVLGAGMTLDDLARGDLKSYVGPLAIHDKEYSKHLWEKHENSALLTVDERPLKNAEIRSALEEMEIALSELLEAKKRRDAEIAAIELHNQNVAAMLLEAATLPSYTGVTGNTLAKKIWDASVALAGKSGYLEVDTVVYSKATVTAATALLRKFSFAWKDKYGDTQYLQNSYCPGGGKPSDKTGHSNADLRTSIYQANFITTWGGKDTVMHINSDSI